MREQRQAWIAMEARRLWTAAGWPKDRDLEFWLAAERKYKQLHPRLHYFWVAERSAASMSAGSERIGVATR
jgi:hypothetical protein